MIEAWDPMTAVRKRPGMYIGAAAVVNKTIRSTFAAKATSALKAHLRGRLMV